MAISLLLTQAAIAASCSGNCAPSGPSRGVLPLEEIALQKLQLLLGSGVTIWPWAILSYALTLRSKKALVIFTAAEAVWDDLRDRYGAPTIPQVYKDFKESN